jgi:hypothetical protein
MSTRVTGLYVETRSLGIAISMARLSIGWYSKKQTTVQTATFGSEFVAARIATDQIIAN